MILIVNLNYNVMFFYRVIRVESSVCVIRMIYNF